MSTAARGKRPTLPEAQKWAVRRGTLLAWWTLAYLAVDTAVLFLIKGNSQAMQAAWIQDLLGMIPPLAFLIGMRIARKRATADHPYGFAQAMDIAHLISGTALLGFGGFLLYQSAMTLLQGERPDIGMFSLLSFDIWQGWVMIAFMFITLFPPLILGRLKMKPAKLLHNKALFADAQMNKADWMAGLATIMGITGIGLGFWWADAIAAAIISLDILADGFKNLRGSLTSMVEAVPKSLGTTEPHPVPALVNMRLAELPWVREVGNRTREEGQYFHVDAYVVPHHPEQITATELMKAREICRNLHWKIKDVSLIPVTELSPLLRVDRATREDAEHSEL
ncbi:Cation efflux family protein [Corynebacterium occultum]|uniref:Cation efflux family protein n=1 Tax=Corynebacterium occultum TaxID=2675219 RepID=A0A6B8VVU3_9CORY|nr:cation diffusion facilitator family transporter [Corynebacterium occultum]QGU07249.1 Cation efflux family protein [Corynebacterium occultum]